MFAFAPLPAGTDPHDARFVVSGGEIRMAVQETIRWHQGQRGVPIANAVCFSKDSHLPAPRPPDARAPPSWGIGLSAAMRRLCRTGAKG
jgi:hypothetical protein